MKLADFDRVRDLKKSADYLAELRTALLADKTKITIGNMHVRPDLIDYIRPAIECALDAEAEDLKTTLAALGVEV